MEQGHVVKQSSMSRMVLVQYSPLRTNIEKLLQIIINNYCLIERIKGLCFPVSFDAWELSSSHIWQTCQFWQVLTGLATGDNFTENGPVYSFDERTILVAFILVIVTLLIITIAMFKLAGSIASLSDRLLTLEYLLERCATSQCLAVYGNETWNK